MNLARALAAFLVPLAIVSLSQGCGGDGGRETAGQRAKPALFALDSTRLQEGDTVYLGNPFSLAVDPWDGSFYVSDLYANRVFRFARGGALMMRYGRPGSGPGEFMAPNVAFPLDDSTVAAADQQHGRFYLFSRNSGALRGSVPYQGRLGMTIPIAIEGVLWAASRNPETRTSALAWDVRSGGMRYLPPLPKEYVASLARRGRYAAFYSTGTVAAWADSVLVGMSGRNDLVLYDAAGRALDTIAVPVARRRGVPADIQRRVDEDPELEQDALFRLASLLYHVHRRPDGSFLLVHHDSDLEGELPGGVVTAQPFISVVSRDRRRACVDAELPVSRDARPIYGFRGDTLFLMDRRIPGERLETWIVRYVVDTADCAWVPIPLSRDGAGSQLLHLIRLERKIAPRAGLVLSDGLAHGALRLPHHHDDDLHPFRRFLIRSSQYSGSRLWCGTAYTVIRFSSSV